MNPNPAAPLIEPGSDEALIQSLLQRAVDERFTQANEADPYYNIHWRSSDRVNKILPRMEVEGLIQVLKINPTPSESGSQYRIKYTAHGLEVAHHSYGYAGYTRARLQKQKQELQEQTERTDRERSMTQAAIESATASKQATAISRKSLLTSWWVGGITTAISVGALLYQIIGNNNLSKELALAKRDIQDLRQQITALKKATK